MNQKNLSPSEEVQLLALQNKLKQKLEEKRKVNKN